ncbi:ABC transporter substrate-binding protein [Halalkalicoccus subterraneus]|uniref:ABC transporter substrate-binding protein n=1 Tax=Halalkalicoccus subterraneus TaxID=2675002 RepID=UPI000EFBCB94|nr:ABC transporter substrate-binding protein [Halalkalicoccus subterraneus]
MECKLACPGGTTRREYLAYGGAVVGGSLLAGCMGETSEADEGSAGSTGNGDSYTVTMSPTGEVTFDAPPESVFTRLTHHAGMAFALGRGNGVNAMHAPAHYDALWNQFVERLPGVSLDWSGVYSSWEPEKEALYELDSDVHLADPAGVARDTGWSRDDFDEIAENVGPWFGNSLSDLHQEPPEEWADGYEYYTLWEQFELVAEAFQEQARYRELAAIREEVLGAVEADLPLADERPTLALVGLSDIEEIYVYATDAPGFLSSHLRPFEPDDAFDGAVTTNAQVDMEALLEADPDVILALGGMAPETEMATIRDDLRDHPVAREIAAVENDRIYAQGARYQGPVLNLFQIEMVAKQLYPERFGAWPVYESGPYPEIPRDEQLFDRERVAEIINGEI